MVRMRDLICIRKSCSAFKLDCWQLLADTDERNFPLYYWKSCRKNRSGLFFAPLQVTAGILPQERWPSGLRYTPGKRAYGSNRTEGSNPSLSAKPVSNSAIFADLFETKSPYKSTCICSVRSAGIS